MISLSLTKNVPGAQLTLTHPDRSLPLNIGTKPSSSDLGSSGFLSAASTARDATNTSRGKRLGRFMLHSLFPRNRFIQIQQHSGDYRPRGEARHTGTARKLWRTRRIRLCKLPRVGLAACEALEFLVQQR